MGQGPQTKGPGPEGLRDQRALRALWAKGPKGPLGPLRGPLGPLIRNKIILKKREQLPTIRFLYLATNASIKNELRNQNTISILLMPPFGTVCGRRGHTTLATELEHRSGRIESRGDI